MSQISSTANSPAASNTLVGNSIEDLDLDVFLDLMLAELQNQDPLNPMENDEMLNTISQIREISANDKLSETLESVLLGQNVATATGLIGTEVEGLTADGRRVIGAVQNVAINEGEPQLELAVDSRAVAGDDRGSIQPGTYIYEVVWESDDVTLSVPVTVNTEELGEDFEGSIRLDNLPPTSVSKQVFRYREGETPRLVGTLPGDTTRFTDGRDDSELDDVTIPADRRGFGFAGSETVLLSQVANVQTR